MIELIVKIAIGILAAILGIFSLYLFARLISFAVLRSFEDIKRKRKEKENGTNHHKD